MRMSTKGRYGLRIMLELAVKHGQGPVMVETISSAQGISANYIHLLAGSLKSAGLVRSVRGPRGGYMLAREPSIITALEVVVAAEGETLVECLAVPSSCKQSAACVTRELWGEVEEAMKNALERHSLDDLARKQQAMAGEAPMYYI